MRTLILVIFWMHLLACLIGIHLMVSSEYPRRIEKSLGCEVAEFLLAAFVAVWAAMLLWGNAL